MSYGLKYFARYKTNDGKVKELRFSKEGYSGASIEWFVTHASVETIQGSSDNLFDNPIVTSQKRLGLFFLERYDLTEFVYDRKTFFCEVALISSGHIEWSGWVEPWDAAHDYQKPPFAVSLTASCGLAHLSKKKYVNPDLTFKKTGLTIIQECLALIGSEIPLRVSTHMRENSFSGPAFNGLQSFEINVARYYNENGEALNCDVIINDILNHFDAEITQWDNRWVVRGIVDHATGFEISYIEYAHDGSSLPTTTPWPETFVINNTNAFTKDGGQERVLPPINKYRAEVDLGSQLPFFDNGNMAYWTDAGLLGWNFSHMPKGNPGWERYLLGGEGVTASVLKINGKAPQPYRKRKKKKWFKTLVQIVTAGVVQLDSTWHDIEPSEWIETSAGVFAPGDKSLTISFDYETAPNSSDVLISIYRKSSWKTNAPIKWVLFGLPGYSSVTEEFHLIRIPPAEREGLIYKGNLNVSGNPNYPDGGTVNWAYTVIGVPAGQIRRIGGPSGIIVENGDLVISKVSNPGGAQSAVGNSWNIIHVRNNPKKGTYTATIDVDAENLLKKGDVNNPIIYDQVVIRFYKIADEKPGDWYKIYNLKGTLEGFVPSASSGRYATTLERGAPTDEESETINLISGDYNPYFSGSWTKPGSDENTSSWSRRSSITESLSIYRAMMLDRLCLTSRPLTVIEGEVFITGNSSDISYLHTLVLKDKGDMRLKIVRYSYNEIQRIVKITAVEIRYEEIPSSELRQDSYIPGEGTLNVIAGQGDGYYPTKSDSTTARISADDLPPTAEQIADAVLETGRIGDLFTEIDPLLYVVGIKSTQSVDLVDYISEQFTEINEDQEEEDIFDPETLILSVIDKPTWVTSVIFDALKVSAVALAPTAGDFYITIKAYDPELDFSIEFKLPIEAINKTIITANLRDADNNTVIGALPGFYFNPEKIDFDIRVKGNHNLVTIDFIGGGPDGHAINLHREFPTNYLVTDFTYRAFLAEAGIVAEVGIYTFHIKSYFEGALRSETILPLTLYDEEYLAKYSAELWDTTKGQVLGVIAPDGSSKFKAPVSFDPKSVISDLEHDKIVFSLAVDGISVITGKEYTQIDPVTEAEYDLFGEITTEYGPGKYDMLVDIYLDDNQVYQRLVSWEIAAKEVLPQAGIQLISYTENTENYEVLADLPLNNSEVDIPDAYGFKIPAPSFDFDHQEHRLYDKTSGGLLPVDIEVYTNKPQETDYAEGEIPDDVLVFAGKPSVDIGKIHRAPSSFRIISIYKKDGEVVAILQADVAFRVPLNPEDYSGLRFITFDVDSGDQEVTDSNMPISGRTYLLPVYPKNWSVAVRGYNGQLFDEVTLQLKKDDVFLHSFDGAYVRRFASSTPITELDNDLSASIFGYPTDDERRYLINPSGEQVLIDDLGEVEVIATFKLTGTLVGVLDTTFTFAEADEDLPIVDFEEVDPTVPQWVKDITEAEIEKWNTIDDLAGDYVRKVTADLITAAHNFTGNITLPGNYGHNTYDGSNVFVSYAPNGGNGSTITAANLRVWNGAGAWRTLSLSGNGDFTWQGFSVATQFWVTSQNYLSSIFPLTAGVGLLGGAYNGTASKTFSIDFGTSSVQVPRGDDSRINNGQIAFSYGDHATFGYLTSTSLTGYVRKAVADNITADHNFTGNIVLPANYGHNTYDGTNVFVNYAPPSGNGSTITAANLRVWNGAGGWKSLAFGGSGSLTWDGNNIATQPWVTANYVPITRTVSAGSGLTGGGSLSANITLAFDTAFGDARYSTAAHTHQILSRGIGLIGNNYNGSAATTWAIDFGTTSVQVPRGDDSRINNGQIANSWGNHATFGYLTSSSLTGYVQIATANTITAAHNFTSNGLTLPGNYGHNTYDGSNVFVSYSPSGGNGGTISVANLRVWNGAGAWRTLSISGNGDFTWQGDIIALRPWVAANFTPLLRNISAGTGLLGGGNLTADISLSVNFGTTSAQVARGDDSRINNGQTAFGYGNHATFGYLTSSSLAGYVLATRNLTAGTGLTGGGNLTADRTFNVDFGTTSVQVARGDDSRINNGATAYSWGNHAGFGYLTSISSGMITSALGYTPESNNRTVTIVFNGTTYTQNVRDNPNFTLSSSGGTITGGGAANYVTKWSGGGSITNSRIYDFGSGWLNLPETYVQGNLLADGYTFLNTVGIGGTSGNDASAILQINSNTKGFLMPRMTYAQRMAISSPAIGLKVFQTDVSGSSPIGEKTFVGSGTWIKNTVTFD